MIICLNNKCNLNKEEFRKYQEELSSINTNHEIILCPTHLNISEMNLETVKLGAQNVSSFSGGPHTGEVSADMLKSYQVQYCIIGHSERRENNKETLEDINEKMKHLINSGISPVLCVGETEGERKEILTLAKVEQEIESAFRGVSSDLDHKVVIAYEPIWSIGTGNLPTVEEISKIINFIKDRKPNCKLLYGGSVNEENVEELLQVENLDGFLLGGLSLKPDKLKQLIDKI